MKEKAPYTPMMMQYLEIKKDYQDALVFYRLGDFYELFFEDAKTASKELELVLTGRDAGAKERVPMCGVPYHAVNSYLEKLVKKGYKVAIVEQLEDPALAKGIVKRDVVQVITPGTLISVGLEESSNNYIASVDVSGSFYIIAYCDLSTGELGVMNLEKDEDRLVSELDALDVSEIVISSTFDKNSFSSLTLRKSIIVSYEDNDEVTLDYNAILEDIKDIRQMRTIVRLINYLVNTQKRNLDYIKKASIVKTNQFLNMDSYTRMNLELTRTIRSEDRYGSLLWVLDKTKTAMGGRLIKNWIVKPLYDLEKINYRLDLIEAFNDSFIVRKEIENNLKEVYDLPRIIARIGYGNANGKDLIQLSNSLKAVPNIKQVLLNSEIDVLIDLANKVDTLDDIVNLIENSIVDNPPLSIKEGGLIKRGFNKDLDELYSLSEGGKEWISNLEIKERERTGIKTLRVGFNKVFGFYIEVSKGATSLIKDEYGYERKQTLTNSERYITPELKEKEALVLQAEEKIVKLEYEIFNSIREEIKKWTLKIQSLADILALIDVVRSLSQVSIDNQYVRPTFNNEGIIDIKEGRHPVIEKVMNRNVYVSNDVYLDNDNYVLLITGPNMGGKSTFMRQVGISVVLAQMGCFIPAKSASLCLVDGIYTRIGASDDLVSGQSTFMVEMIEANNALKNATEKSLIIFDELGRGTSTYDGMALAQAIIEYISVNVKAKTLFSTHYHELTKLEESLNGVINIHVEVFEENNQITFLYKVKKGSSNKSYGINVARLANLPEKLLVRANDILNELEQRKVNVTPIKVVEKERNDDSLLIKTLKEVDPLTLSPLEALNFLYDLHQKVKKM
ncbi:TPA: DNA mismatch repair protein MutS [bacterium]|jgi:DNA mismatch repair protein MutS|nr:DNA mismatch repair protein MutS [bacterium]